jgi:hypothetical protein
MLGPNRQSLVQKQELLLLHRGLLQVLAAWSGAVDGASVLDRSSRSSAPKCRQQGCYLCLPSLLLCLLLCLLLRGLPLRTSLQLRLLRAEWRTESKRAAAATAERSRGTTSEWLLGRLLCCLLLHQLLLLICPLRSHGLLLFLQLLQLRQALGSQGERVGAAPQAGP